MAAMAQLTRTIRKLTPYAPVMAANWMINGYLYWECDSKGHGSARKVRLERIYSRPTQTKGAARCA